MIHFLRQKPSEMKLKIDNIQAKDLFDTGTPNDPQDPALRITIGGQELFTKRSDLLIESD